MSKNTSIISIGDELLIGQVTNTNATYMSQVLERQGLYVQRILTVGDTGEAITAALNTCLNDSEVILLTGGLGPTKDDITKKVLCTYFNTTLVSSEEVKQHVERLYKDRPCLLNTLTATQWEVPKDATILTNRIGSAPIMVFTEDQKVVISLPGVPNEMRVAMDEQVIPFLQKHLHTLPTIHHHTLLLYGVGESVLAGEIAPWEDTLPEQIHLAYLPDNGLIRLRVSGYDVPVDEVERYVSTLRPLVQKYLLGEGNDLSVEELLGQLLVARGVTISTAESCTGGKIGMALNRHAGASKYYKGTLVAYDSMVKRDLLKVDISRGVVSEEVARTMAENVRELLHTDYAIATTGFAGPDGDEVGKVCVAWSGSKGTTTTTLHLRGSREHITDRATKEALMRMVREILDNR